MTADILIHKRNRHLAGTFIPNTLSQDESLTWGARGLLGYMLSLPPDWRLNEKHLVSVSPGSRDHLRKLVRELEEHGYMRRTQVRGKGGHMGFSLWEVWETKQPPSDRPVSPLTDFPLTVDPSTVDPSTENPSTYKENNKQTNINQENPPLSPRWGEAPQAAPDGRARSGQLARDPGQQPQPAQAPVAATGHTSTALVDSWGEVPPPAAAPAFEREPTPWPQEAPEAASGTLALHSPAEAPAAALPRQPGPDRGHSGTGTAKPKKARDRFASKVLPADAVPDNLLDCQQLLAEWWECKARGRTETAFRRACSFLSEQPPADRRQILERAVIGGYQGLHPLPVQSTRQGQRDEGPLAVARRATEMIRRMEAAAASGNETTNPFFP